MITKLPESSKPLTARQTIRALQAKIAAAQDLYCEERAKEFNRFDLRSLRNIVRDASAMDLSADGERIFNAGTRHEWVETKI